MQAEQSVLDRIQSNQLQWHDTSLECMIVVDQRFTSGRHMVGGVVEDRYNHGRTK